MSKKPFIQELKLEPCCKATLKDIEDRIKLGKLLKAVLSASPFITMLGSNPVGVVFTIVSTDWDKLTEATKAVPIIVKRRCYDVAVLHSFEHPGGELNRFWVAMADVFR